MSPRLERSPEFDDVRDAHRSERAPVSLRRRSLEWLDRGPSRLPRELESRDDWRHAWARHQRSAAAFAAAGVGALLLWLLAHTNGAGAPRAESEPEPEVALAARPEPQSAARSTGLEPRSGGGEPAQPCPRQPSGEAPILPTPRIPQLEGMTEHVLRMPISDCIELSRRYLQRLPDALPARARVPVMILLHDTGQSPERTRLETRWYFEALARERRFVLIYASAESLPPAREGMVDAIGQADSGLEPRIEALYLERVVGDLVSRGVIADPDPVWLVGFGGGATLALTVAAKHPDLYAGVAAFGPDRFDIPPPALLPSSRLERVLLVAEGKPAEVWGGTPQQRLAQSWALALGVRGRDGGTRPRTRFSMKGKLGSIDLANDGQRARSVRVLTIERGLDAFPPPGAVEPLLLAELRRRPDFFNGAQEAWQYLENGPAPRR
jgi:predicted esterase